MTGRFVLSDDSHAVAQLALNYFKVLQAIKSAGIQRIHYLRRTGKTEFDPRFRGVQVLDTLVTALEKHKAFRPCPSKDEI